MAPRRVGAVGSARLRRVPALHRKLPSAVLLPFALLLCSFSASRAQPQEVHRLTLQSGAAPQGDLASLRLEMTSSAQVQGLVAVFEWDPSVGEGIELIPGEAIAQADMVVRRVEAGFMLLGVVMNTDGMDNEIIDPGEGLDVATARIRCLGGGQGEVQVPVRFADGKYSAVEGAPRLDNVVSVGGLSIGVGEGLELIDGLLTCSERPRITFTLESGSTVPRSRRGTVSVRMDNPRDAVEAYVLAVQHPATLTLEDITIAGTAAEINGADFSQVEISPQGGTLGVVMDLVAPFAGNVIPPGVGNVIARMTYRCDSPPMPPQPAVTLPLEFVDGVLGVPPKDNFAVVGGRALAPVLESGTFTCLPLGPIEICDDGIDNDGDGLVDCADPDCAAEPPCVRQMFACGGAALGGDGRPETPLGQPGFDVDLCFFYKSPEDNVPGPIQFDQIQGLSMAVSYPCELQCQEGTFDVAGTIVEAVGADFVSHRCDNDPNDGDGCELIIGILVDVLPPFEGGTLPPTDVFLRLGCLRFTVRDDRTLCGRCLPVEFRDGINARGKVPIINLISVENHSRRPQLFPCEVCIQGRARFHRGDCNFSRQVNIADVAALIGFLFARADRNFQPPCLDACDCNDDGRVDLADAMCILGFLFRFGPFPPAPGPGFDAAGRVLPPGEDPTEDSLDCQGGRECVGG